MNRIILYNVEGDMEEFAKVAKAFNSETHEFPYKSKSGLSTYLKNKLGKEFKIKTLAHRDGVYESDQIVNYLSDDKAKFYIPITDLAYGKNFNMFLIVDLEQNDDRINMKPISITCNFGTVTISDTTNRIIIETHILNSKEGDKCLNQSTPVEN